MQLKSRLGFVRKEVERGLLLIGDTSKSFEQMGGMIGAIEARDSRIRLVLSSAEPGVLTWLQQRFPAARVLPLPFANRLSTTLYLQRLNIRTAAFLESGKRSANRALLAALNRRAITIVTLSVRRLEHLAADEPIRAASEALIVVGGGGQPVLNGERRMTDVETADFLAAMLARDLKARRESNSLSQTVAEVPLRMAASPRWRRAIAWRIRRFNNLQELKGRLASPKVILCLGNGPSSEDPVLSSMGHDVLFRVNHSWLRRDFLARPDVVFTGGRPTMRAVSAAIFGLQSPAVERRLIRVRALNPSIGRTEFFNVNDLTPALKQFDWGHLRPTNGVSMLATAVALNPEKLIVAGVDLFQHPDGSYPGDIATPNAYSPGHSRETELDYILQLLSNFRGEIIIVGEILLAEWERHRRGN